MSRALKAKALRASGRFGDFEQKALKMLLSLIIKTFKVRNVFIIAGIDGKNRHQYASTWPIFSPSI